MGALLKFTLEDHLMECEQRFNQVVNRLEIVDERLTRIELLILDLKEQLRQ